MEQTSCAQSSTLPLLDNEECRGLLLSIIPVATTAQAVQSSEEDKIKVNNNLEETKDGTTSKPSVLSSTASQTDKQAKQAQGAASSGPIPFTMEQLLALEKNSEVLLLKRYTSSNPEVAVGTIGVFVGIDSDGDACVKFPGRESKCYFNDSRNIHIFCII